MGYQDILQLQSLTGAKAKQAFLSQHNGDAWFRTFLYYALNPLLTYNLSEGTIRSVIAAYGGLISTGDKNEFKTIFDCCEFLSGIRAMDNVTLFRVQDFLCRKCKNEAERELYIKLLAKTLRLGVTAKTVNKAMGALIPEWEVQQSFQIDKYPLKEGTEFWLTQKLNGVRATFYDGKLIARSGQPYTGLNHILKELSFVIPVGLVLDGELTLRDKGELSDNEAFRTATGIINSDEEDKSNIGFTLFDAIPYADFCSDTPQVKYEHRRIILDQLDAELRKSEGGGAVSVLPVLYHGYDQSMISTLLDQMVKEDKEGLMVNTNVPYKRARHRGILKVKRFYTMDLEITGAEKGSGRLADTLGALVVSYKGNAVSVGSGFSDEQRAIFWEKRDELIGSLCEVKYKETSYDQRTGLESLQFPVFVRIRDDKSEESYG